MAHIITRNPQRISAPTVCARRTGARSATATTWPASTRTRTLSASGTCTPTATRTRPACVKADIESDNLATKQANRDVDKLLPQGPQGPAQPRSPARQQSRRRA